MSGFAVLAAVLATVSAAIPAVSRKDRAGEMPPPALFFRVFRSQPATNETSHLYPT